MATYEIENQISAQTKLCMIEKCSGCNDEVELVSGAIIYGDKWYHNACWKKRSEGDVI